MAEHSDGLKTPNDSAGCPSANARTLVGGIPAFLNDLAHEVGHVLLGPGHPDAANRAVGGVARLDGTAHHKRLMRGGKLNHPDGSHLLVKAEWDKAETWLKDNVDTPNPNE
jgi:hypothetical protein